MAFDLPTVPDYYGQFMAPLLQQQQVANQTAETQQNAQLLAMKVAAARQAQAQQQQYSADVQNVIANGARPDDITSLMLKYPDEHDALQQTFQNRTEAERDRDVNAASSVYASLANGRPDVALGLLQDRKQALSAAGQDTSIDDALIGMIQSGDPAQVKKAQGIAGYVLASAVGPDKIGSMLGTLDSSKGGYTLQQGDFRYDSDGNLIAVGGAARDDGTTPAPSTTTATAGADAGAQAAVAHSVGLEGGYNPKDANGSPTNWGINFAANKAALANMGINASNFRNMTKDQATQVYLQKYWPTSGAADLPANLQAPYFDVYIRNPALAKAALAKSGGDPAKFVQISNQMFQPFLKRHPEYASSYQQRFDSNMAIANGQAATDATAGATPDATGQPPAPPGFHWLTTGNAGQYRVLSDAEVKQRGLDPSQQYQLNTKTGQITGLGQKTSGVDVLQQYGIAPNDTGQAVLDKLPTNLASQVKALADGRLGTISSFALAKPYWQTILQLATQYDPTFDMNAAPARKAAIQAFTGMGKGAQLVGSINRVANHLDLLWADNAKLAGPNTGFGPLDTALAAAGQSFERPAAASYDGALSFVSGELGKLAKAGVVSEGEIDRIIGNMSRHNSFETRKSAIQTAVGIIAGALDPLKDQYNSAFTNGSTRPNIPWVSPKAQQVFEKIGGADGPVDLSLTGAGADTNSPADSGAAPVQVNSPADAMKLAPGTLFRTPDGRVMRKR